MKRATPWAWMALTALCVATMPDPTTAQTVGTCNLGTASRDLDGNNVRARLYNNGHLFWKGSGNVYTVPKTGAANAIFASGIWIGGLDEEGALRFAGTAYGPFEYWPGPLDAAGNPPPDCSEYDRIFKVTRGDLAEYELHGTVTDDMEDWPHDLGAPVHDGDGIPDNYDLAAGDRPGLIGEQTLWWVMNDVGGPKEWSKTKPIGLEVQVTAFAFTETEALDNTTFYRYRIVHRGQQRLSRTWLGIWSDPDLGNAADDYVGCDTTLGLGFVYNGQDVDQGADGYGDRPPALGYDFLQGPLVPDPSGGTWVDPDGTEHPGSMRRQMTAFIFYNGDSSVLGNPSGSTMEPYYYLQSRMRDGNPRTYGGNGYGGTEPTRFMFPGDPAAGEYWSEENTDGRGSRNTPADRRMILSTGPFDLEPGDVQDIIYAIIWSRSADRLASVTRLKLDDLQVQATYGSNFRPAPAPDRPEVTWDAFDQAVVLEWSNSAASNNYLNGYDETGVYFAGREPEDGNTTYSLEGYQVLQFDSPSDRTGEIIATYDVVNGTGRIVDQVQDPVTGLVGPVIVAEGADRGIQNYHRIEGLVNFRDYEFGVRAYGFNPHAQPKALLGPVARVTVRPAPVQNQQGGMVLAQDAVSGETVVPSTRISGTGGTTGVFARISNPAAVTGHAYEVQIGQSDGRFLLDLTDATSGAVLVDGAGYVARTGRPVPMGEDLMVVDGLSFTVMTEPDGITAFTVVANAGGPLDPPEMGAFGFNSTGFPFFNGSDRPGTRQQVNGSRWGIHTGEGFGTGYDDFVRRSLRSGWDAVVPHDWEIRFSARCRAAWEADQANPYGSYPASACYAYDRFSMITDAGDTPMVVPFEVWNIGSGTPDDPLDDFRLIPAGIDWDGDGWNLQCSDHEVSGGTNDPVTDWIFTFLPDGDDRSPGEAGYDAWKAALLSGAGADHHGSEVMARLALVNWNGGSVDGCPPRPTFTAEMPEVGTIFRMVTSKPLAPGDVFRIDSGPFAPLRNVLATADDSTRQVHLDQIGIVPNPYRGASAYERNPVIDEVRFTNLPDVATIRIYTVGGTLVRTLRKNSPSPVLTWDLLNDHDIPIGSGMYLIHVRVPGVGEKVLKFGAVIGRVQLDLY